MKIFKISEAAPKIFARSGALLKKFGIDFNALSKSIHPPEDFLAVSKRFPIFAVADGVTLELDKHNNYPKKSGAAEAARIFCQTTVTAAERIYNDFMMPDVKQVFTMANTAVGRYNRARGRFKGHLNYWDFDLFAATAVFAVVKNRLVYWASICDSYVAHFDAAGAMVFKSPHCWDDSKANLAVSPPQTPEEDRERKKNGRRLYRNGVAKDGSLIGYGVVTGEKAAERYLNVGKFAVREGDLVFLFTDGFENYMGLPAFINLFKKWPGDLKRRVKKFTAQKALDDPKNFGRERTLIAIKF